jgi:hypothetical protein
MEADACNDMEHTVQFVRVFYGGYMIRAVLVNFHRTVDTARWAEAEKTDPFLRASSLVQVGLDDGMATVLDDALTCGGCSATLGALAPEPVHPENQINGRRRCVHLLPVYFNRDGEPFYRALVDVSPRSHTVWHTPPDTSAELTARLGALNVLHDRVPGATIVRFECFKVKCHGCGTINFVEVSA